MTTPSNGRSRPKISRTKAKRIAERTASASAGSLRYAGLGRLSLLTDETTSPDRQQEIIAGEIKKRHGVYDPATDFYEDLDVSGFSGVDRPGFDQLMENLDQYDVVVVYRLDRLTRRLIEFAHILEVFKDAGVTLVSATEPFDTSDPMGQAMVYIIMVFAQMESETIGARVQSAQEFMVRNGRSRGGQCPFGWVVESSNEKGGHFRKLDERYTELLRNAVHDVIAGKSVRSIALEWNTMGILSTKGRKWSQGPLMKLLRNPVMVGFGIFGEDLIRDTDGTPLEVGEPLISQSTYYELLRSLNSRGRGGIGVTRKLSLLGNIVKCAHCGQTMYADTKSYKCGSYNARHMTTAIDDVSVEACPGAMITKKYLEPYILDYLVAYLADANLQRETAAAAALEAAKPSVLERDITKIKLSIDRLREDREDGLYDSPEDKAKYKAKIRAYTAQLADLTGQLPTAQIELASLLRKDGPITLDWLLDQETRLVRQILHATVKEIAVVKGRRGGTEADKVPVMDERVTIVPVQPVRATQRRAGRPRVQAGAL